MPVCLSVCMSVCMSVSIRVFYHLLKISSGNPHLKVCDIYRRANISKSCNMQFMDSLSLFLPTTHRADRLENPRNYQKIKKNEMLYTLGLDPGPGVLSGSEPPKRNPHEFHIRHIKNLMCSKIHYKLDTSRFSTISPRIETSYVKKNKDKHIPSYIYIIYLIY